MKIAQELAMALRVLADNIEKGTCPISEDRMYDLYQEITDTYIDRTAAAKILGISVSYFDKLRQKKLIPDPIKKRGEKPMWSRNTIKSLHLYK